jgi:hypothetical protein
MKFTPVILHVLLSLALLSCDSAGGTGALDFATVLESWCQRETYCNPDADPEGVCIAEQLEWFDEYFSEVLSGENLEKCKDARLEGAAYEAEQECGDSFVGSVEWIEIAAEIMIACDQCLEHECVIGRPCFGSAMRCGATVSGEEIVMYCVDNTWTDDGNESCEAACENFDSIGIWHPTCSKGQQ